MCCEKSFPEKQLAFRSPSVSNPGRVFQAPCVPCPSPGSACPLRVLAPLLGEWCLEAKMWELGVLAATDLSLLLDFPAGPCLLQRPTSLIRAQVLPLSPSGWCVWRSGSTSSGGRVELWKQLSAGVGGIRTHFSPTGSPLSSHKVGPLSDPPMVVVDAG